jgi:DNA-binding LacI/PurR family transcriptional regulator
MAKPDRILQNLVGMLNRYVHESFQPGEVIPSQRVLGSMYGVAPETISRALKRLAKEGLVQVSSRRGWTRTGKISAPPEKLPQERLTRLGLITRRSELAFTGLSNNPPNPIYAALTEEARRRNVEIVWVLNRHRHQPTPGRRRVEVNRVPWNRFQIGLLVEVEDALVYSDPILKRHKVLAVDWDATPFDVPSVAFADSLAGSLIASHFLELGHRRLAASCEANRPGRPLEMTWMLRRHGFEAEAGRWGLSLDPEWYFPVSRSRKHADCVLKIQDWCKRFAKTPRSQRPSAIALFSLSPTWASDFWDALNHFGIAIPQDLSVAVIGYGQVTTSGGSACTYVHLDVQALASRIFDTAENLLANSSTKLDCRAQLITAPVLLVPGTTTRPLQSGPTL